MRARQITEHPEIRGKQNRGLGGRRGGARGLGAEYPVSTWLTRLRPTLKINQYSQYVGVVIDGLGGWCGPNRAHLQESDEALKKKSQNGALRD